MTRSETRAISHDSSQDGSFFFFLCCVKVRSRSFETEVFVEYQRKMLRNPMLLFWGRAFLETKALTAIIVLFYMHRGVTLDEVFYLSIIWSLTSLVTEIPSGYLADRIGRKRTILLGAFLLFASILNRYYATGFWMFVSVFVLMSSAFSCFSGTEEAMLFESLKATGQEQKMTAYNGRLFSARSMFRILFPTIGATIAKDLLEWQFQIVNSIDAVATIVAFIIFLFLTEPTHERHVAEMELGVFRQSLKTIKQHPWMMRVSLNKIAVFTASFFTWRVYQPLLTEHGVSTFALGIFFFLTSLMSFVSTRYLGLVTAKLGTARFLCWTAVMTTTCLFIGSVATIPWVLFSSLLFVEVFATMREPAFSHIINHHVHSESRVTTLSNLNMIKGVVDIPIIFLGGYVATINIRFPLVIGIITCLIALFIVPIRKSDEPPVHT